MHNGNISCKKHTRKHFKPEFVVILHRQAGVSQITVRMSPLAQTSVIKQLQIVCNNKGILRPIYPLRHTPYKHFIVNSQLSIENYHNVMGSGYSTTNGLPPSYVSMRTLYCPSVKSGTIVNSQLVSVTLVMVAALIHSM